MCATKLVHPTVPTVSEVMKTYNVPEKACHKKVTDKHLDMISRSCCKEWKSLPSYLGLETIVADDISRSGGREEEKRHGFLLKWRDIRGSRATYKHLIEALLDMKCVDDAEKVCKLLKDSTSLQPRQGRSNDTGCAVTVLPSSGN